MVTALESAGFAAEPSVHMVIALIAVGVVVAKASSLDMRCSAIAATARCSCKWATAAVGAIVAKTGLWLQLATAASRTGVGHPSDTATSALVAGRACEGSSVSH